MSRANEHVIVEELQEWAMEVRMPLPLPMADVVWTERCGLVVDLQSGERFYPTDDWHDFTERWVVEMRRRGVVPEAERLAAAIQRANDYGWSKEIVMAAARVMLDKVLEAEGNAVGTVQVAA